jgi:hypothetical protein
MRLPQVSSNSAEVMAPRRAGSPRKTTLRATALVVRADVAGGERRRRDARFEEGLLVGARRAESRSASRGGTAPSGRGRCAATRGGAGRSASGALGEGLATKTNRSPVEEA